MPFAQLVALIDRLREGWRLSSYANRHFMREYGPGHFYSPLPDIADVRSRQGGLGGQAVSGLPGIDLREAAQLSLLESFAVHYAGLPFPRQATVGRRYHLDNPFFAHGDGVVLWSMMAQFRPRRVVEVGSGFSSAAMLDAADALSLGDTSFDFIDPFPERLRGLLTPQDEHCCRVLEQSVQDVPDAVFDALGDGDFLFIDSSHVAKVGSDVNDIFARVIPRLRPGVIIHVHDICWPFEYPMHWFEDGRAWNEAYMLRAFLQFNQAFEILFFNDYMATHHRALLAERLPIMLEQPGSRLTPGNTSLWMRRTVTGPGPVSVP